jgi:hypothetical protein
MFGSANLPKSKDLIIMQPSTSILCGSNKHPALLSAAAFAELRIYARYLLLQRLK